MKKEKEVRDRIKKVTEDIQKINEQLIKIKDSEVRKALARINDYAYYRLVGEKEGLMWVLEEEDRTNISKVLVDF